MFPAVGRPRRQLEPYLDLEANVATARGQRWPPKGRLYLQVGRDQDGGAASSWRWAQTLRARGRACERERRCYQLPPGVGATSQDSGTRRPLRLPVVSKPREAKAHPGREKGPAPLHPPKKESAWTPARPEEAIRAKSALEFRFSHRTSLLRPGLGRCVTPSVCRTVVHVPRLSLGRGAHSTAETRGRWAPSSEHPGPHVRPASSRLCPSLQASDGAAAPAD